MSPSGAQRSGHRRAALDFIQRFRAALAYRWISRVFPDVRRIVPAAFALLPVSFLNGYFERSAASTHAGNFNLGDDEQSRQHCEIRLQFSLQSQIAVQQK